MPSEEYNSVEGGFGIVARRVIAYIVLIIITVLCLFWFYLLIVNSTRSHAELSRGFTLLPSGSLYKNFDNVIHGTQPILRGMLNSFIVAGCCALFSTYFSAMTAYAIHVYDFKLKKAIFTFILAVMMIPTQVTALGFIKLIGNLRLDDSFLPLIIPSIAAPATFYYMKQYMESALPHAIVEAARIDGSPEFRTFNEISLPIMKPAIAVQLIFTFVTNWNNYFTPALVLHSENKKTLPILIAALRSADFLKFDMGQVYVTIALSIFPVVIVYLFLSRYIVTGVAVGSVKG
ncbi:MAG: carbohydrate ABC transporter permease [Lachnospiraceae bacterium]|nr:carbohydrate ABC transporter permease [Candidatus Colinaster equi]